MNPLNPPGSLKSLTRFFRAAKQIEKVEPVVAYYCRFYAISLGLKLPRNNGDDSSKFLGFMLDSLEKERTSLGEMMPVSESEAQEYFKNFSHKVFKYADDVDRAGKANKNTSRDFLHAAVFLEAYEQFETNPDVVQLKVYAKWKAVQILTALKNGQVPPAGPLGYEPGVGGDFDFEMGESQPTAAPTPSPLFQAQSSIPSQYTPPAGQTPPIQHPTLMNSLNSPFPPSSYAPPASIPQPRFDSTPPQFVMTNPHASASATASPLNQMHIPQPNWTNQLPATPQPNQFSSSGGIQATNQQHLTLNQFSTSGGIQSMNFSATQTVATPPPQAQWSNNQQWTPQFAPGDFIPTDEAVMSAMQHSKYVLSALQFEDVPTAVQNLRKCLVFLTQPPQ